jgi:hypothetical protein
VANNLTQGATAGQLLAQGNGAYLIQQGVDPDTAHTLIAAQRASPQTVTAVSQHTAIHTICRRWNCTVIDIHV